MPYMILETLELLRALLVPTEEGDVLTHGILERSWYTQSIAIAFLREVVRKLGQRRKIDIKAESAMSVPLLEWHKMQL